MRYTSYAMPKETCLRRGPFRWPVVGNGISFKPRSPTSQRLQSTGLPGRHIFARGALLCGRRVLVELVSTSGPGQVNT